MEEREERKGQRGCLIIFYVRLSVGVCVSVCRCVLRNIEREGKEKRGGKKKKSQNSGLDTLFIQILTPPGK